MVRIPGSGVAGRLAKAVTNTPWTDRAKQAAGALKAEYEAGKRGDTAPPAPIWGSPKEQLDAVIRLVRGAGASAIDAATSATDAGTTLADRATATEDAPSQSVAVPDDGGGPSEADADDVVHALRGVDWAAVRAATAERGSDAARAMRSLADQVDWDRVQPVAARISSALIAAVASGRLGVGGPLASTVARAIIDQGGLAERVASRYDEEPARMPPDFRGAIEASSREV